MSTEMLTKPEHRAPPTPPPTAVPAEEDELHAAARRQLMRVRRLKIHAAAWILGSLALTALWVLVEWQANGAFQSFGHEGDNGQWNPTLWALVVLVWALVVGIMALRVHFERPVTEAELGAAGEFRELTRTRLERVRRLRFHVAAWVLGMILLTPVWALIEWQDNGPFERWSDNSQPGDWEPWILYVGGIWLLVIAIFALQFYLHRPPTEAEVESEVRRLRSRS